MKPFNWEKKSIKLSPDEYQLKNFIAFIAMKELVVKLKELSEILDSARFVPVLQSQKLLVLPQPCCHLSSGDLHLKVLILRDTSMEALMMMKMIAV